METDAQPTKSESKHNLPCHLYLLVVMPQELHIDEVLD
jgi:hypothetical protein